ncbi:MAG: hypothetical protein EOM32_03745 [Spirochaetia bacterium]|nr:hypothetical protein [Spirochaetia bacterium]NCC89449.1 hypothetical protein [Spirochaetia bacterium]
MRDLIILIGIYASALLLAGFGIVGLLRQKAKNTYDSQQALESKPEAKPLVSTEDMLSGWGKEEEEAKQ